MMAKAFCRCLLVCAVVMRPDAVRAQADAPPPAAPGPDAAIRPLQVDLFGSGHFSRFNFTNLRSPYDGVDAWTVLRVSHWWDHGRRLGIVGEVNPVFASAREFFFQRYVQFNGGMQCYPVTAAALRPLRVFGLVSRRAYYDGPPDADLENTDLHVGVDYYYDNLFAPAQWKSFAYTTAGYRTTAFGLAHYDAVLWSGSVKTGRAMTSHAQSIVIPYAVVDWTYAGAHRDRFWENFLRAGGGVRWYPKKQYAGRFAGDLRGRLHLFGEVVRNVVWLGDRPSGEVSQYDVRVGAGFSTGGIYRHGLR
jgi:hypothetical protein